MAHIVGKGFRLVVTEAVVVAHHKHRNTVAVAQQLQKLARIVERELVGEVEQHRHINAVPSDFRHLVGHGHQHFDVAIGTEYGLGVLCECNDSRFQMPLGGDALHLVDEREVPKVHTVEHADGGNGAVLW